MPRNDYYLERQLRYTFPLMFLQEFTAFAFSDVETPIISPGEGIPVHQETLEVRVAFLAFYRIFSYFQVKFDTHNRKPR